MKTHAWLCLIPVVVLGALALSAHVKRGGTDASVPESAPAADTDASTAVRARTAPTSDIDARRRWEPGALLSYRLSARSSLTFEEQADPALRMSVEGTLVVEVGERSGPGWTLRLAVLEPDVAIQAAGSPDGTARLSRRLAGDLARDVVLDVAPDGSIARMHIDRRAHLQSQQLWKTFAAQLQLVTPDADARRWEATEEDGSGTYVAEYRRPHGSGHIDKTKERYLDANSRASAMWLEDLTVEILESKTQFTLDARGRISGVATTEHLHVTGSDAFDGGASQTHISLDLQSAGKQPPRIIRPPADAHAASLGAAPSPEGRREVIDRAKIAGMEFVEAVRILDQHGTQSATDRKVRYRTFLGLEALFRQDADAVTRAATHVAASGNHAELIVDALGQGGSIAAQGALRDLFHSEGLHPALRHRALMALRNTAEPTIETVALHESLLAGPHAGQAHLGLGTLTRAALDRGDEALARRGIRALLSRADDLDSDPDRIVVLKALGNSGHPDAEAHLLSSLETESPRVRATAVEGLRFLAGPHIDTRITGMAERDPVPRVRLAALRTLGSRRQTPAIVGSLSRIARTDTSAAVRYAATQQLIEARASSDAVRETLEWIRANDADDGIRALAARGLG